MGSKNMVADLANWTKRSWPTSRYDFFAMFIERGLRLSQPRGLVAMITMQSWMFLSAFEALRESILSKQTLLSLVHLGPGAFEGMSGEVVSTAAFVLSSTPVSGASGEYIRLVEFANASEKRAGFRAALVSRDCEYRFVSTADEFASLPGKPIAYWIDSALGESFATPALGRLVTTEGQNKTAKDDQYLRPREGVIVGDRSGRRDGSPTPRADPLGGGPEMLTMSSTGQVRHAWSTGEIPVVALCKSDSGSFPE